MVDEMANLRGRIVLGSDWQLACSYGRGLTRSRILEKKENMSAIGFAQEYGSQWTGCTDDALVNISRLLELRVLSKPELKGIVGEEYIIGVDVARSENANNNQSSAVILKIIRKENGAIEYINCVNLINISNILYLNIILN
jgi:ribonucleoside-diphosphate reductase alpha chain